MSELDEERIDRVLEDCLLEIEALVESETDRACDDHPELASDIRLAVEGWRRSGFAPTSREALLAGRYRLLDVIGRGGQGVVHRGRDVLLDREVAVKILDRAVAARPTALQRFERESRMLSSIAHPAICQVLDVGHDEQLAFIVMPSLRGHPLSRHAADLQVDDRIASVTPLFEILARALHAAHEQRVLHRDVKPDNVIVTQSGPVLLDFGLSRSLDDETLTSTGDRLGSPAYMSPEQITGEPVDGRSDVWSLCVSLHECLTGDRPFTAPTRHALEQTILHTDVSEILNPALPRDMRAVLAKGLQRDPALRYRTAGELADDLARLAGGEPVAARPASTARRTMSWCRRNPVRATATLGLACSVLVLATLLGFLLAQTDAVSFARERERLEQLETSLGAAFAEIFHGEPATARSGVELATELDPTAGEVHAARVLLAARTGRSDEAIAALEQAPPTLTPASRRLLDEIARDGSWIAAGHAALPIAREEERLELVEPLEHYLAGVRLMRGCSQQEEIAVLRDAVRHFHRAVMTSPEPRLIFHAELAHALGHLTAQANEKTRLAHAVAEALVSLWPSSPVAWRAAGDALEIADPRQSLAAYEEAARLDPRSTSVRLLLAHRLHEEGRTDEALALYRELATKAGAATARFDLACVLGELDRPGESEYWYRAALAARPDFDHAVINLGELLRKSGRLDEALDLHRGAAARHPRLAVAHENLGLTLRAGGRAEQAIASYETALGLQTDPLGRTLHHLGNALLDVGRNTEAATAFSRAVMAGHRLSGINQGVALRLAGRLDEALRVSERTIEDLPDSADAWNERGLCLATTGRPSEAITAYERSLRMAPDAAVTCNLGSVHLSAGRHDLAIGLFEAAVQLDPDHVSSHYNLALAHSGAGRPRQALAAFEDTLSLAPDHAEAHAGAARQLRRTGRVTDALHSIRRAHELGRTRKDWSYPSLEWIEGYERVVIGVTRDALLRDERSISMDVVERRLRALLAGWHVDLDRGERRRTILRRATSLREASPWIEIFEECAASPSWEDLADAFDDVIDSLEDDG